MLRDYMKGHANHGATLSQNNDEEMPTFLEFQWDKTLFN